MTGWSAPIIRFCWPFLLGPSRPVRFAFFCETRSGLYGATECAYGCPRVGQTHLFSTPLAWATSST